MAKYYWMFLNMSENAWINCSDYASSLNMPRYSYNNIIITVTNVIISEFLFARFEHPGALLPFYLFKDELERKNNKSMETFTKLFFIAAVTSELSKYLKEQLGCIFKCETTK